MPKPGDRVIVEGTKVGGGRREGTLVDVVGRLIRVRWDGGSETIMTPAPGAVRFLPGSSTTPRRGKRPVPPRSAGRKSARARTAARGPRGKARRR